ncbi:MAG: phosphoribosyltransferase domain-containing protein [Actinomycetota bacterium]|nr:phosphoribosyltransferase domain-containing protein [Actinomycetota bacterium]
MHRHERLWRLEWPVFEDAAAELARRLAESEPETIVAVARGGLPLGERLASSLDLPLVAVTARGNQTDAIESPPAAAIALDARPLEACREFSRIAVCDDIAGSGATLRALRNAIARHSGHSSKVVTATLCRNEGADPSPDISLWAVTDWVLFPWEGRSESWDAAEPLALPRTFLETAR